MRPVRFAFPTTFYPPYHFGGDAIGIQRLAHALVRRGHEVTVVHDVDAYRLLAGGREPTVAPSPPGLTVVRLESGVGALSPLTVQQLGRPVFTRPRLRSLLDRGGFDVVNFHNVSLIGGPGLLGYGGGAIRVYMAHEHWLVCPSHVLWRHGRERCTGRQCLRCVLHYRRPPQLWRYTGSLERQLRKMDLIIAMSEFSRDKHREFGLQQPMEVLPYFLPDGEATVSKAPPSPHPRPYFLFVGRLEKIKGLDDVIPLFRDYPDADLLIAGDGEYRGALEATAAGLERVRFLGRVDAEALEAYYRNAVALIVPSVCFETFGIILIEAFRFGTPVIARRLGPFPEIVTASGAGALFETPVELRQSMAEMQRDPTLRATLGAAGRQAFQDRWAESVVVPRYLEMVAGAAEARGRGELADRLRSQEAA